MIGFPQVMLAIQSARAIATVAEDLLQLARNESLITPEQLTALEEENAKVRSEWDMRVADAKKRIEEAAG